MPDVVIYLMVAALMGVVFYPRVVKTVPSGHVGVLWKRFAQGTVLDPRQLKDEGLHLILPWDELFLYDLRVKSISQSYSAISRDGVNMLASLNIRYRLKRDTIPTLHQVIGPDYLKFGGARQSNGQPSCRHSFARCIFMAISPWKSRRVSRIQERL